MDLFYDVKNYSGHVPMPINMIIMSTRGSKSEEKSSRALETAPGLWVAIWVLIFYHATSAGEIVVLVSNVM